MVDLPRFYEYVGTNNIKLSVTGYGAGMRIESLKDLEDWIDRTGQGQQNLGSIAATLVIDF